MIFSNIFLLIMEINGIIYIRRLNKKRMVIKMKKLIRTFLFLILAISMLTVNIFAINENNLDITSKLSNKESIAKILENNQSKELNSYYYYKNLNVIQFDQGTTPYNPYCGPTSVKQVIHYINGSSNSILFYADKLGVPPEGPGAYVYAIRNVLNEYQNRHTYNNIRSTDFPNLIYYIQVSLNKNCPAIINVKNTTTASGFPYITDGHYLTVSGLNLEYTGDFEPQIFSKTDNLYSSPVSLIKITDTWYQGYPNNWYNSSIIYNIHNNHPGKNIIY